MNVDRMQCDDFRARLDSYIDGDVAPGIKMAMDEHARQCAECAELLDRATAVATLCAELDEGLTPPLQCQAAWRGAVRAEAKKRKGRMKRAVSYVAAAAALVLATAGGMRLLSGGDTAMPQSAVSYTSDSYAPTDASYDYAAGAGATNSRMLSLESDGALSSDSGTGQTAAKSAAADVRVIRSAARRIQTDRYDADYANLGDLVSEHGAYFESRSTSGDAQSGRSSDMVIRVPSAQLDSFLTSLDVLGKTTYSNDSAEDVSARYTDTETRLTVLRSQLEKLNAMNESAVSVEDLIAINDKATEVVYNIEQLEGELRDMDGRISYSSVMLKLTEVVKLPESEPVTLGERVKRGFDESVEWLRQFCQNALVFLAALLPKLAVIVPACALAIVIIRIVVRAIRKGKG